MVAPARRGSLRLALAISCATIAPPAWAQNTATDQQLAQSLFDQGRSLMEARRYAEACPRFAESQRLDPGAGTQINLALCHEKEGKTATAWAEFNAALSQAIKDGRKDRLALARERIAALEAVLPRLTVTVAPRAEVPGFDVKLDGVSVRKVVWGTPAAVDPGTHRLDASAPGYVSWSVLVPLVDGEKKQLEVPELVPETVPPPLPPVPAPSDAPPATSGGPTVFAPPTPPGGLSASGPPQVTWETSARANPVFYTVLVTALVSLAASGVTGGVALMEHNTSLEVCQPARQYCSDPNGISAAGNARSLAIVSTVTLSVGVLAAATLLLIPTRVSVSNPLPQSASQKTLSSARWGLAPLAGGAALVLGGNL